MVVTIIIAKIIILAMAVAKLAISVINVVVIIISTISGNGCGIVEYCNSGIIVVVK